jgi:hypothetical protein
VELLQLAAITFNAHVVKSEGCWKWKGSKTPGGYGKISVRVEGKPVTISAHRVSYELHIGQVPSSKSILHRCDNTECTNPKHLFLGTQLDNMKDKLAKGRGATVVCISNVKLTPSQVTEIWYSWHPWQHVRAKAAKSLASRFGVSVYTVRDIWLGRTWGHVTRSLRPDPTPQPQDAGIY